MHKVDVTAKQATALLKKSWQTSGQPTKTGSLPVEGLPVYVGIDRRCGHNSSQPADQLKSKRHSQSEIPTAQRNAAFKVIKTKVGRGEHFGQHDDLPSMHREVFGDVEDGFEDFDIVALDFANVE